MRRTRLPKASTGAKEALTAELEKAQGPAEIPAPVQACDNRQQLREILKELHEKDVQGLLRSAASKSADGESRSNFSVLEARLGQPAYTQEQFTVDFRQLCTEAIVSAYEANKPRAQAISQLLDYGNVKLAALERMSGASTSQPARQQPQQRPPLTWTDNFWAGAPSAKGLLKLKVQQMGAAGACTKVKPAKAKAKHGAGSAVEAGSVGKRTRKGPAAPADADVDSDGMDDFLPAGQQRKSKADKEKKAAQAQPAELQRYLAHFLELLSAPAAPAVEATAQLDAAGAADANPPLEPVSTGQVDADATPKLATQAAKETSRQQHMQRVQQACEAQVDRVRSSAAGEATRTISFNFKPLMMQLQKGEAPHMDELCEDVNIHCRSAADDVAVDEAAGLRRSKLMANVDLYSTAMAGGLKAVAAAFWRSSEHLLGVGGAEEAAVRQRLPESILANREPYFQGEWRQQPYVPRPYQRLTQYEIGEERETLLWKLRTQKRGGCSGQHCSSAGAVARYSLEKEGFETECTCLASNIECDDTCGCHDLGTCLNRAVTGRATLQLDKDLKEINSWGMDCYTRRNIHDAVLESEAFGPYKRPDYNALVRQPDNVNPLGRGETLHHEVLPGQQQSKQEQSRVVQPHDGVNGAQLASASDPDSTHGPPAPPPRSGHMPISSDSPDPEAAVKDAVTEWVERRLMPAVSCQGAQGWNILNALTALKQQDEATGNMRSLRAAKALEQRVHEAGLDYFRLHPKGVGLMCTRAGGLPPLTFVEEYLGELHAPWRWFEIQDAIKKTSRDELPDFYNIVLERPKDDPAGYDALFIDAASKGSFASRMSHSCSPNCQAVVMACAGRLTIAVYTLRHIREEEELTFDYASVTESEKEFRDAICLCGTRLCRGSFLYFAGSRAFSQIMAAAHTMLHRQAALLKAGTEPLTSADRRRLEKHGLRECALGRHGTRERVPEWLEKWAALILEYVEEEEARLPNELLAVKPPLAFYTPASAAAEAKGVRDNRIQNVVITLDKVKMCLQKPDQPLGPPLRMLSDDAVQEHLWTGDKSIAKRVLRGASAQLSNAAVTRSLSIANSTADLRKALERYKGQFPHLQALGALVLQPVATGQEAKAKLVELAVELRRLDLEVGGGHTAAADMVYLYAMTQHWFTAERNYKGFSSPPVQLNMDDLDLDRTAAPDLDSEHAQPSRRVPQAQAGRAQHTAGAPLPIPKQPVAMAQHPAVAALSGAGDTCGHQPAVVAVVSSDEDVDITGSDVKGPSRLSLANGPSEPATNGMSIASLASSSSRKRSKPDSSSQPAPATQEQVEVPAEDTACSPPKRAKPAGGRGARSASKPAAAAADPQHTVDANGQAASDGSAPSPAEPALAAHLQPADSPETGAGAEAAAAVSREPSSSAGRPLRQRTVLSKKYGPWFIWGQLNGWYKQTVYDPTASLSAERRGTLSLPDIESCYGGSRARYTQKDRDAVLDHISKRPDAMWKIGTLWSFRNEAKIYGSPMFDAVWAEFCPEAENRMPKVIQTLRSAATPFDKKRGGAAAGGRRQEHTLALAEEGSV